MRRAGKKMYDAKLFDAGVNKAAAKRDCAIIAAFCGCGKTYAAKHLGERALDMVCVPYKYNVSRDSWSGEEDEKLKATYDSEDMRAAWPTNYVEALEDEYKSGKWDFIFIPPDMCVLALLEMYKIPYVLAYPQRECKEEYERRFIERGNSQEFLDVFIGRWDRWMNVSRIAFSAQSEIELAPGEFLLDAMRRCGLL